MPTDGAGDEGVEAGRGPQIATLVQAGRGQPGESARTRPPCTLPPNSIAAAPVPDGRPPASRLPLGRRRVPPVACSTLALACFDPGQNRERLQACDSTAPRLTGEARSSHWREASPRKIQGAGDLGKCGRRWPAPWARRSKSASPRKGWRGGPLHNANLMGSASHVPWTSNAIGHSRQ